MTRWQVAAMVGVAAISGPALAQDGSGSGNVAAPTSPAPTYIPAPPPSAPAQEQRTAEGYIRVEPGQPAQDPPAPPQAEEDEGDPDEAVSADPEPPEGAASVDFQTFQQALSPYGQWIYTADNGWVWEPNGESDDWTPYSDGEWQWTAYGWTFCGAAPWAWAAYHYGRWLPLNGRGWGWVPGYTWGPAWVAWRSGPGYVGWSPLRPGWGYGGWGNWPIVYNHWNFTPLNRFYGGPVRGALVGAGAVAGVWALTNFAASFRYNGAAFLGPHPGVVGSALGHPITPLGIHPLTGVNQVSVAGVHDGMLNVVAPRFFSADHPFSANGRPMDVAANAALGNRLAQATLAHPSGTEPYRGELHGSARGYESGGGSFSTYHAPSVSNGYGSYAPYRGSTAGSGRYAGGYHGSSAHAGSYAAPHYGGGSYGGPRPAGYSGGYHPSPAPHSSGSHPAGQASHGGGGRRR